MRFFVYILQSELNNSYYKGQTNNLEQRVCEHNSGKEKSTSRFKPWKLVWYCTKETRAEAITLENNLKNITSRQRLEQFIAKYPVSPDDQGTRP